MHGVFAAYMHVLTLADELMVVLMCPSSSDLCQVDSSGILLYGRPGAQLNDHELRRLATDVRTRTVACVDTQRLQRVPINGLSNQRVVLITLLVELHSYSLPL